MYDEMSNVTPTNAEDIIEEEILDNDVYDPEADGDSDYESEEEEEDGLVVSEDADSRGDPKSYKAIRDMLSEVKEWNGMYRSQVLSALSAEYNLSENALYGIGIKTNDVIDALTLADYESFYDDYCIRNEDGSPAVERPTSWPSSDEEAVKFFKDIKELQVNIYTSDKEYKDLVAESDDIMRDYINYMSSDAVMSIRRKNLQRLRNSLNAEHLSPEKRKEIEKMISIMENTETLNFLFSRIEEFGKNEIDSIVFSFFDPTKGKYVINKFKNKITMFGFNSELYKYFFNLEELFLPSEYHVFNNLFLFIYMRFVAYAEPRDKTKTLWVQAITSAISNLVYHKYPSTENEAQFIVVMKKYLDNFKDYHDYFMMNNTTHPEHPERIKHEAEYEQTRRATIINKMKELHITGYDENWTSNKLYEYMNAQLEELDKIRAQDEERKNRTTTATVDGDGVLTIEPIKPETAESSEVSESPESPELSDESDFYDEESNPVNDDM